MDYCYTCRSPTLYCLLTDRKFEAESRNMENDFVEGLVYSRDTAVVMVGRLTDECEKDKYNPIGTGFSHVGPG